VRRKLRTTLTVLRIVIGIWALLVFSSMATKINRLVDGGSQFHIGVVEGADSAPYELVELAEGSVPDRSRGA
jgi:hypothetical protein